jgi:hypothetical protein
MRKSFILLTALCLLSLGSAQADGVAPSLPSLDHYAEGIYAEYAAGTGDLVAFEVATVHRGELSELSGRPLEEILERPDHQLTVDQFGTYLLDPQLAFVEPMELSLPDLALTVDGFTEHGYPVERGSYRLLEVQTSLGSDVVQHQAIELCWPSLGHCTVYDPAVEFLQSTVDNRLRLAGEGWGPREVTLTRDDFDGIMPEGCALASDTSLIARGWVWNSYYLEWKNLFGITMVTKSMGKQQAGLRCNSSCYPDAWGFSNTSSCFAQIGYSCSCDNDFGYGKSGRQGKMVSETKCTHKAIGGASASATVLNYGTIGVDISWNLSGSVNQNGGSFIDTCGYY